MKKTPVTEKVLLQGAWISEKRLPQPEGSVDEGIAQQPVAPDCDTRLKKIYVYADNVFTPQSLTDSRTIRVQTEAFDLTGWIDFTHARPQDQFQVEVRVWWPTRATCCGSATASSAAGWRCSSSSRAPTTSRATTSRS